MEGTSDGTAVRWAEDLLDANYESAGHAGGLGSTSKKLVAQSRIARPVRGSSSISSTPTEYSKIIPSGPLK